MLVVNFKSKFEHWCSTWQCSSKRRVVYMNVPDIKKYMKVFVQYKGEEYSTEIPKRNILRLQGWSSRKYRVNGIVKWAKTIMSKNPADVWVFVSKIEFH